MRYLLAAIVVLVYRRPDFFFFEARTVRILVPVNQPDNGGLVFRPVRAHHEAYFFAGRRTEFIGVADQFRLVLVVEIHCPMIGRLSSVHIPYMV